MSYNHASMCPERMKIQVYVTQMAGSAKGQGWGVLVRPRAVFWSTIGLLRGSVVLYHHIIILQGDALMLILTGSMIFSFCLQKGSI